MAYLKCKDLTLGYNSKVIIENLSFSVNKGDYLCILGENGSGKSTLMKTLLHLIKPISGTITTGDGFLSDELGYLPQQTAVQKDFPASVNEIVLSGCQSRCKNRPFYIKQEKQLALSTMEQLGIAQLSKKSYKDLSGGQQQRVLLARALCATQKMLLLDEPVTGLDPLATEEMYKIIEDLNKNGVTIIMISHDVPAAMKYASHILHIGKDIFFGETKEYDKYLGTLL